MKMTITIHGVNDDQHDEIKSAIENMIAYGWSYHEDPAPDMEITTGDDDADHKVRECAMCHVRHFAQDLDANGLCDDCAAELEDGETDAGSGASECVHNAGSREEYEGPGYIWCTAFDKAKKCEHCNRDCCEFETSGEED